MTYDIITIGGGLAGSALGKAMAEKGARVLILEQTTEFKDRIRGEQLCSWGAAEARELGIYDLLVSSCANEMTWWDLYMGPSRIDHRDLLATTADKTANLTFYHPAMQETLLRAAEEAGAEVRRGCRVTAVVTGTPVRVTVDGDGQTETIEAGIVAACDGRSSPSRSWGGFEVKHEPDRVEIAGILMDGVEAAADTGMLVMNPMRCSATVIFPQGNRRARTYMVHWKTVAPQRFQGESDIGAYLAAAQANGVAPHVFADAAPAGPLATFDGADTWVAHPYTDGLALVGDAAAASDPSWGQGLSLTLRDVRELRDQLLAKGGDPDGAGHAYAEAHDGYYGGVRAMEEVITQLFYEPGDAANERRAKVLSAGPDAIPEMEILQSGPEVVPIRAGFREQVLGAA